MKRIQGYVLVKESNQGVPNLVVCAFDSETRLAEIIGDKPRATVTGPLMEKLGKRIGSVLTDSHGAFQLTSDDLQFEGVESRPDLVLAVLAPEDILDSKRPFVLPPEKRLLYISAMPRAEAGAEEAYVIRLRQSQLDQFQIPIKPVATDAQQRLAASEVLISDLETSATIHDNLEKTLHPRLKAQHMKLEGFREAARETVKLSALPPSLRDHPHLLTDVADLPKLQEKVIKEGVQRLSDYKPRLQLSLTDAQLKTIRTNKGRISTSEITAVMRDMLGGVNLVRKDDPAPSAVSASALYQRYSLVAPSAGAPAQTVRKKSAARKATKASPRRKRS